MMMMMMKRRSAKSQQMAWLFSMLLGAKQLELLNVSNIVGVFLFAFQVSDDPTEESSKSTNETSKDEL